MEKVRTIDERLTEAEAVLASTASALHECGSQREQIAAEERRLREQLFRAQGAVSVLRDLARAAKALSGSEKLSEIAGSRDPAISPGALPSPE